MNNRIKCVKLASQFVKLIESSIRILENRLACHLSTCTSWRSNLFDNVIKC